MKSVLLILVASFSFGQCPTVDSNGWCVTGLSAIQNNLLGPLTPINTSPWIYGDIAEPGTAGYMTSNALAEIPVLGAALSGTFSWTQGGNLYTTSIDQTTALSGVSFIVVAWNTVDGAGTGRNICNVGTVTSTTISCSNWFQIPMPSGTATAYLISTNPGPSGFNFYSWAPQNGSGVSTTWNYYDVAIGLYRLYWRTNNSAYLTAAQRYADVQWQWTIDHGYGYVAPRVASMISQFYRAGEGHSERLPGLYNYVGFIIPFWAESGDRRESGYTLWDVALGAKVETDPTRHAQYCSWLGTYVPFWNSQQSADGSWGENEFALNQGYVSAPKSFTPPFQYQAAPWRESINIKSLETAQESLADTSGCNNPTLAATTLTTITNAVTWQWNYGRDTTNRGVFYEVNSQSNDQASVSPATGTVSTTLTSTAILGVGTNWLTAGYCDGTHFIGFYSPQTVYKIASCADNTHATLTVAFGLYGESSNDSSDQFGVSPAASSSCGASLAAYCFVGAGYGDRNLTRTLPGGIGWLYAKTLNATYKTWGDELFSANLGGPTAGLTTGTNLGSFDLPCSGPACDGLVTDNIASAEHCNNTMPPGTPPCAYGVFGGNLGKNYGEAWGAPGIDNYLAWRLVGSAPIITSSSPLPAGTAGIAYSYQFTATGTGITWTGTVPGWATLSSSGLLTGTPLIGGVVILNITATNSSGSAGPTPFSLTILSPSPPLTCSPKTHVTPPTATDIQLQTNMALATAPCTNSLTGSGCTVVDVQRIINAALGAACVVGP